MLYVIEKKTQLLVKISLTEATQSVVIGEIFTLVKNIMSIHTLIIKI